MSYCTWQPFFYIFFLQINTSPGWNWGFYCAESSRWIFVEPVQDVHPQGLGADSCVCILAHQWAWNASTVSGIDKMQLSAFWEVAEHLWGIGQMAWEFILTHNMSFLTGRMDFVCDLFLWEQLNKDRWAAPPARSTGGHIPHTQPMGWECVQTNLEQKKSTIHVREIYFFVPWIRHGIMTRETCMFFLNSSKV